MFSYRNPDLSVRFDCSYIDCAFVDDTLSKQQPTSLYYAVWLILNMTHYQSNDRLLCIMRFD